MTELEHIPDREAEQIDHIVELTHRQTAFSAGRPSKGPWLRTG
jgi:hypothetical protein